MTASGAQAATGRGRQVEEEQPEPGSRVSAAAPNSLPPTDEANASPLKDGASGSAHNSLAGPLRLSDPRCDEAFERGAIKGFDAGYKLGLQGGARLAALQLSAALQGFDTEGAE